MQHIEHDGSLRKRIQLGRYPERGSHDFATIAGILDTGTICRIEESLYVHGSGLARWMNTLPGGTPVCVTVSLIDELVLARSA